MIEAISIPMMGPAGTGPGGIDPGLARMGISCVFEPSLGKAAFTEISNKQGKEAAVKAMSLEGASLLGEKSLEIWMTPLKITEATYLDKSTRKMVTRETLIAPEFGGDTIQKVTDAGEKGTGTLSEWIRTDERVREFTTLATSRDGPVSLFWVSPGEEKDGNPIPHRAISWIKDKDGKVTEYFYVLPGSRETLSQMMDKLGWRGEDQPLEEKVISRAGEKGKITHSEVVTALSSSLTAEEGTILSPVLAKLHQEATLPDALRESRQREYQRGYEEEFRKAKDDIEIVLASIAQGVAAIPRVYEESKNYSEKEPSPESSRLREATEMSSREIIELPPRKLREGTETKITRLTMTPSPPLTKQVDSQNTIIHSNDTYYYSRRLSQYEENRTSIFEAGPGNFDSSEPPHPRARDFLSVPEGETRYQLVPDERFDADANLENRRLLKQVVRENEKSVNNSHEKRREPKPLSSDSEETAVTNKDSNEQIGFALLAQILATPLGGKEVNRKESVYALVTPMEVKYTDGNKSVIKETVHLKQPEQNPVKEHRLNHPKKIVTPLLLLKDIPPNTQWIIFERVHYAPEATRELTPWRNTIPTLRFSGKPPQEEILDTDLGKIDILKTQPFWQKLREPEKELNFREFSVLESAKALVTELTSILKQTKKPERGVRSHARKKEARKTKSQKLEDEVIILAWNTLFLLGKEGSQTKEKSRLNLLTEKESVKGLAILLAAYNLPQATDGLHGYLSALIYRELQEVKTAKKETLPPAFIRKITELTKKASPLKERLEELKAGIKKMLRKRIFEEINQFFLLNNRGKETTKRQRKKIRLVREKVIKKEEEEKLYTASRINLEKIKRPKKGAVGKGKTKTKPSIDDILFEIGLWRKIYFLPASRKKQTKKTKRKSFAKSGIIYRYQPYYPSTRKLRFNRGDEWQFGAFGTGFQTIQKSCPAHK